MMNFGMTFFGGLVFSKVKKRLVNWVKSTSIWNRFKIIMNDRKTIQDKHWTKKEIIILNIASVLL